MRLSLFLLCSGILFSTSAQDVLTHHNDTQRSGAQTAESVLTPANVVPSSFAKLFSFNVEGDVYAQPLYVSNLAMPDGKQHNVLFVATQHDLVYAFDADGNNPSTGYLWKVSLLGPGETWVSSDDVSTTDIAPDIGITGTPVIDRAGATLYVVAKSKSSDNASFFQRLHALSLTDGSEKLNGPTLIQATLPGTGDGGSTVSFNALRNNQRAALLRASSPGGNGNSVYITWASHGDNGYYHGWVLGYDAADISQQTATFVDTPNGIQGGVWMSGGGIAADGQGNLFLVVGNGTLSVKTGGIDYGDSVLALTTSPTFGVASWFAPYNFDFLNQNDLDMGTSAALLLPDQPGPNPHLLVTSDKTGKVYLLNRDMLGGFVPDSNNDLQELTVAPLQIHNSFAFWNNQLYIAADGGPLFAWTFDPVAQQFNSTPQQSPGIFGCDGCNGSGSTPGVSANGNQNGIVWALDNSNYGTGPAVLHAYLANNIAIELYNSAMAAGNRDQAAAAVKFTTPTVAKGMVYVGGRNAVTAYGLFQLAPDFTFAPQQPGGDTVVVDHGSNAVYSLVLAGNAGYRGDISLTCGQMPVNATCSISPSSAVVAGNQVNITVSVSTQLSGVAQHRQGSGLLVACFGMTGVLVGIPVDWRRRSIRTGRKISGIVLLATLVVLLASCGGSSAKSDPPPPNSTPPGVYTLQIKATDGSNTHVLSLTLIVQ